MTLNSFKILPLAFFATEAVRNRLTNKQKIASNQSPRLLEVDIKAYTTSGRNLDVKHMASDLGNQIRACHDSMNSAV